MSNYYTIGQWKGLDNYECGLCPFSSIKRDLFLDHMRERHKVENLVLDQPVAPAPPAQIVEPEQPAEVDNDDKLF